MKIITGICILLLTSGVVSGWFLFGGFLGSVGGLLLTGCLAVPLYCLAGVFARNTPAVGEAPFHSASSSVNLDPSQLPKSAYNRLSDGGM